MPLFGRHKPPAPTEAEREAANIDLERIRRGGIPLGAEERLKRIATASTPFFTSDLSAKEYALAEASDLRPIAQVMGSSVVQHGWYGNQVGSYWGTSEVRGLSDPWNLARTRAFDRLRHEANLAAADAVIGIELTTSGTVGGGDNVEYVVFGTAVRDAGVARPRGAELGLCALSGQDVDKLRRIGARICDVVGHTTVVSVALQMGSNYMMNSGGWMGRSGNTEIREISEGVYEARSRVMSEARRQASAAGANNIVVSVLTHGIEHREYESQGSGTIHYFYVTMHLLGTAIELGAHQPHPAPLSTPVLSIDLRR